MNITEVQIDLANEAPEQGSVLLAYVRVVLDDEFIIHDVKLIRGTKGLMVSMPGRPHRDECFRCLKKTDRIGPFCMWCGQDLGGPRPYMPPGGRPGRAQYYADIMHPLSGATRLKFEEAVIEAYHAKRKEPATSR